MERRNHAVILLFVFGIIGVYSFPQKLEPSDGIRINGNVVEYEGPNVANLQVTNFDHDEGALRVRRDGGGKPSQEQAKKAARIDTLRTHAIELDFRRGVINQIVAARHATSSQIASIIESYMREGLRRDAAVDAFRNDHPTLSSAFFPTTPRSRL